MRFWEFVCLVLGAILLIAGLAQHSIALVIIGIILLAIGGVLVYFVHFHDGSSSGSSGGGGGGGGWDWL